MNKNIQGALLEQAGEIFCDALEIDFTSERIAYIKKKCAGNETLQITVFELFDAHEDAERLFQLGCRTCISSEELMSSLSKESDFAEAARTVIPPERDLGLCIGPYRLIRKIGEGGGGSVYLAEQEYPVRRQVALKVLRLGTNTKRVIERFEAERQVLAIMEHPNIARVLDAGETEEGLPYFVMELVHGVKITDYCDEQSLDVRQREELFLQVCHAIQHAHQKGIIHRDIKPSNILIAMHDRVPVPKVIDFGIAKAISEGPSDGEQSEAACDLCVGTPAYMSPEQAGVGEGDVDMRSDVYSLGVLLYELLVGRPPFVNKDLIKSGLDNMFRVLRHMQPPPPSAVVCSMDSDEQSHMLRCRNADVRCLNRILTSDLDWIVMRALNKDREHRYQSVDGLADDVMCHLNHEPVKARPPSRTYQFQKFVHRNKGVCVSLGAIAVVLMVGFGTSSWLFLKARKALREQVRLRAVAEQAQQSELKLREEAEVREKITQAALLLRRGKPGEADLLVGESPVPIIKPSLEASDVFSQLGSWNVAQGQWEKAADRMLKFSVAMRVDQSDMTDDATRGLLQVGPVLVAAGDLKNYHLLVAQSIAQLANTDNPIAAEQLLKLSLIIPADSSTIDALLPLAEVVRKSVPGGFSVQNQEGFIPWRVFSLSLFEYRRGHYSDAVFLAERCLVYPESPPVRTALCHILQSMAYKKLHQSAASESGIAAGRALVARKFPSGLGPLKDMDDHSSGYWNDWIIAYLLLEEALSLDL